MIKFSYNNGNVEQFTIILSTRDYRHLGQIVNFSDVNYTANLNAANELSFKVTKVANDYTELLWDDIVDFKLVYVKELNEYFEITVTLSDQVYSTKTLTCKSLCESELSQGYLYQLEINTENDIAREDYDAKYPTLFYRDVSDIEKTIKTLTDRLEIKHTELDEADDEDKIAEIQEEIDEIDDDIDLYESKRKKLVNSSLLHRLLDKFPAYYIKHVDQSLKNLMGSFSISENTLYDFLTGECAEQFNCLFKFDSTDRGISAYDLYSYCSNPECDYYKKHKKYYRGDFYDKCPHCGTTNPEYIHYYGKDTTVFVSTENLTDEVQFTTDTGSVKNCFRVEGGDDYMTAVIRQANASNSSYIYEFTDDTYDDMPDGLVEAWKDYSRYSSWIDDDAHIYLDAESLPKIDENNAPDIVEDKTITFKTYNKLCNKYNDSKYGKIKTVCPVCDYSSSEDGNINDTREYYCPTCGSILEKESRWDNIPLYDEFVYGYQGLIPYFYDCIDFASYLKTSMMAYVGLDSPTLNSELKKINDGLNQCGGTISVSSLNNKTSVSTIENAIINYFRIFINTGFVKCEISNSSWKYVGEDSDKIVYGNWTGQVSLIEIKNEENVAYSSTLSIRIDTDYENFLTQKIQKTIEKKTKDEYSINGIVSRSTDTTYDSGSDESKKSFQYTISKYSLTRLQSIHDAIEAALGVLLEEGQGQAYSFDKYDAYLKDKDSYEKLSVFMNKVSSLCVEIEDYYNKVKEIDNKNYYADIPESFEEYKEYLRTYQNIPYDNKITYECDVNAFGFFNTENNNPLGDLSKDIKSVKTYNDKISATIAQLEKVLPDKNKDVEKAENEEDALSQKYFKIKWKYEFESDKTKKDAYKKELKAVETEYKNKQTEVKNLKKYKKALYNYKQSSRTLKGFNNAYEKFNKLIKLNFLYLKISAFCLDINNLNSLTLSIGGKNKTIKNYKDYSNLTNGIDAKTIIQKGYKSVTKYKEYVYKIFKELSDNVNSFSNTAALYDTFYVPYRTKLDLCDEEITLRTNEIHSIMGLYVSTSNGKKVYTEWDNNLSTITEHVHTYGAVTYLGKWVYDIKMSLVLKDYLNNYGKDYYTIFTTYIREQTYKDENIISDGIDDNKRLLENAQRCLENAKKELHKSATHQHSISSDIENLLAIDEFKPIVDNFELGNWIRVKVDDTICRLRLIKYSVDFNDISTLHTEFSDVTITATGFNDINSILNQASSMAGTYNYVTKQAKTGASIETNYIDKWVQKGFDSSLMRINNNSNEEIVIDDNGITARTYDDIAEDYSEQQLRITHNVLAFTDDNWRTVKTALGKFQFSHHIPLNESNDTAYYDEKDPSISIPVRESVETEDKYGLVAEAVLAGWVVGSHMESSDIISSHMQNIGNYSYIDFNDASITSSVNDPGYYFLRCWDKKNEKPSITIQKDGYFNFVDKICYIEENGKDILKITNVNLDLDTTSTGKNNETLSSKFSVIDGEINSKVSSSDFNSTISQLPSSISMGVSDSGKTSGSITLSVTTKGNSTSSQKVNFSSIQLNANQITLSGSTTFKTFADGIGDGTTTINGGCIKTGTIQSNNYDKTNGTGMSINLDTGTISSKNLNYNGTSGNLTISGKITSSSGKIGQWNINDGTNSPSLYYGTIGSTSSAFIEPKGFKITASSTVIIGGTTSGTNSWVMGVGQKFGVKSDGTIYSTGLVATSANLSGKITATSGKIGNWIVDSTTGTESDTLKPGSLHSSGTFGSSGVWFTPSDQSTNYTIGGKSQKTWRITIGSKFGIDKSSNLYTSGATITASRFQNKSSKPTAYLDLTGDDEYWLKIGRTYIKTEGGDELHTYKLYLDGTNPKMIDSANITDINSEQSLSWNKVWSACTSDKRLKENIIDIDTITSVNIIEAANPCQFNYINKNLYGENTYYGVIAQDLETNLISKNVNVNNLELVSIGDDGYYSVNYQQFIPHLINFVKYQQNQIQILKDEIKELKDNGKQ